MIRFPSPPIYGSAKNSWTHVLRATTSCHHGRFPLTRESDKCWNMNSCTADERSEEQSERLSNDSLRDGQLSACLGCDWSAAKREVHDWIQLGVISVHFRASRRRATVRSPRERWRNWKLGDDSLSAPDLFYCRGAWMGVQDTHDAFWTPAGFEKHWTGSEPD